MTICRIWKEDKAGLLQDLSLLQLKREFVFDLAAVSCIPDGCMLGWVGLGFGLDGQAGPCMGRCMGGAWVDGCIVVGGFIIGIQLLFHYGKYILLHSVIGLLQAPGPTCMYLG